MEIRRILTPVLLLLALTATAQRTPLLKYDIAPLTFEMLFIDLVENNPTLLINTTQGQYVGQGDASGGLNGYGTFINNDGAQITGKFRNGQIFQGIRMTSSNALVGGCDASDTYCCYNLGTGQLEYVSMDGQKQPATAQEARDYTFMTMRYANGDQYVGECYKGKRHGMGIYYYAEGGYWFGLYRQDLRFGPGAWFRQDNTLTIGIWDGEDIRRATFIPAYKSKKK